MDVADRTQQDLDFLEKVRPREHKLEAEETGYCLFCGEEVPKGHRWCDISCRNA